MVVDDFARNPYDTGKARAHADNAATVDDDDDDGAHLKRAEPSSHAA